MAGSVLVDAGFIVALLSRRDTHHGWASAMAERFPPPWKTCEAAVSEAFYMLGARGASALAAVLRRRALLVVFDLEAELDAVLRIMDKYANVPASLADASLVRMTETLAQPVLLTTDRDFRVYRRLGRQTIPAVLPD